MKWPLVTAVLLLSGLAGCGGRAHRATTSPAEPALLAAESVYADLRGIRDQLDVSAAQGRSALNDARPFAALIAVHNALRAEVIRRLVEIDSSEIRGDDARALGVMRRALAADLDSVSQPSLAAARAATVPPACSYDPLAVRAAGGLDSLRTRVYACYGWAQSHLVVNGDTLDRLTILGALGREEDGSRRKQLFLELEPVWRAVNADNGPASPYRSLIAYQARESSRSAGYAADQVQRSGVTSDSVEPWLVKILSTWREVSPDSLIEPWDWYYTTGKASRRLSPHLSRERIVALNAAVYRALGAGLDTLHVQYDLDPRDGKSPVAFTTFGARPRFVNGSWRSGEPWVFATYRSGGLDNLNELLHETGHAVHIAAIRARPAFADWPDSDPFTEAVADLVALDVYEPSWQQRWLGDSVPPSDGLRGRYGGIVLDVAWALLELRMLRNATADPNAVWSELTRNYLRIRPHPELSWWAMRGQLIDAPGYMMNYAVGAMISAAIRAITPETGDWYRWIAPRLFRYGLERPSREVLEEFLGGPVLPAALIEDMKRISE
jgi:hypothetical protein